MMERHFILLIHTFFLSYFFWRVCWIRSKCAMNVGSSLWPWVGKISWRRKWQSTPVFLLGKSHRWRSLVGYSPWDRKELDMTEQLHFFESCESLFHKQRFMVSLFCTRCYSGGRGYNIEQNKLNSWPHGVVSLWLFCFFFQKLTLIYFCIKVFFWASLT